MIVVVGRVQTDVDKRGTLVKIGQRVAAASRNEPGCVRYQVCQDTENENSIVFVEEWQSQDALDAHFASPHIAEFMAAVPAAIVEPPEVKFHTIASSRELRT